MPLFEIALGTLATIGTTLFVVAHYCGWLGDWWFEIHAAPARHGDRGNKLLRSDNDDASLEPS